MPSPCSYEEAGGPNPQYYFTSKNIIASSPKLKISNYNEPTQGHLATTNNTGEMLVQWWVTREAEGLSCANALQPTIAACSPAAECGALHGQWQTRNGL